MRTTGELLSAGLSAGRIRRMVRDGASGPAAAGGLCAGGHRRLTSPGRRGTRGPGRRVSNCSGWPRPSRSLARGRREAIVLRPWCTGSAWWAAARNQSPRSRRAPGDRGSRTGDLGVLVHIAALPAEHVVSYRGVLLTSVPRTVIDLARTLPFAQGVAVADSALHAGTDVEERARRSHRGVPAVAGPAAGPRGDRVQRRPIGVGAGVPQPGRVSPVRSPAAGPAGLGRRRRRGHRPGGLPLAALPTRSARPTGRSSIRLRPGPGPSWSATRGCAPQATRSCTSPGPRSPGSQPRSWTRSSWPSADPAPPDEHGLGPG